VLQDLQVKLYGTCLMSKMYIHIQWKPLTC